MPGVGQRKSYDYPKRGWGRIIALVNHTIDTRFGGVAANFIRELNHKIPKEDQFFQESRLSSFRKGGFILPVTLRGIAHIVDIPFSAPPGMPCQRFTPAEIMEVAYDRLHPRVTEIDPKPRLAIAIDKRLAQRGQTLEDLAKGAGVDLYRVLRIYCLGGWGSLSAETEDGRRAMDEFHRLSAWLDGSKVGAQWFYEEVHGAPYPGAHNNAPRAAENGHPV